MTAQTILPANTLSSGYDVANSVRFNGGDSAKFNIDHSGAGNRDLWTLSMWVKRSGLGAEEPLFNSRPNANFETFCGFAADDTLVFKQKNDGSTSGQYVTTRKFRDVSAWYHFVFVYDKDNSTAGNRGRIYVNGVEETLFGTESNFSDSSTWNSTNTNNIGNSQSAYFDGYMCEIVFIDGQALTPASFGEFDSDSSSIWKPIDVSGLTPGTNGFWLDFKDGSNLGNNAFGSGSADWTETNIAATEQSTDTCTNNACTWNTLYRNGATFTQGNLVYQAPGSNPVFGSITTFGVSAGKWYAECKYHAGSSHYGIIGICDEVFATLNDLGSATNTDFGKTGAALGSHPQNCTVAYVINTGKIRNNNNNQNYGSGGGDGDIINIALDRDNRKVYFGINGTYENSGDPAAGSNGFDISGQVTGDTYFLGVTNDTGASETILDFNFGGGFGQTAVSSANADANGHGNFEYAVPSGFFAWNTKNLAENG